MVEGSMATFLEQEVNLNLLFRGNRKDDMTLDDEDQLSSLNTSEEGSRESEIVVGIWDYTCWKCHERTPVIEWSWQSGEGQMWTEDDRIGQKLQQTFPYYRKDYTRMTDAYY